MHHQNELIRQILNTMKHSDVASVEFACLKHKYSSLKSILHVNTTDVLITYFYCRQFYGMTDLITILFFYDNPIKCFGSVNISFDTY